MSAALQQDPGVTYRRWIAALLPDLLKGTFNHDARTEVCRGHVVLLQEIALIVPGRHVHLVARLINMLDNHRICLLLTGRHPELVVRPGALASKGARSL